MRAGPSGRLVTHATLVAARQAGRQARPESTVPVHCPERVSPPDTRLAVDDTTSCAVAGHSSALQMEPILAEARDEVTPHALASSSLRHPALRRQQRARRN
ncbi:hypothetical protein MRX96_044828 [Rhipicephalus microplus]